MIEYIDKEEILPCGRCGSSADNIAQFINKDEYTFRCKKCGRSVSSMEGFRKAKEVWNDFNFSEVLQLKEIENITSIKQIEPELESSEWLDEKGEPSIDTKKLLLCSKCDQPALGYPFWEGDVLPSIYCPHCGRKMKNGMPFVKEADNDRQ